MVPEELTLNTVHEVGRVIGVFLKFDDVLEQVQLIPRVGGLNLILHAFLISPMRRNPVFCHGVHFLSPDLNFQWLTFGTNHRGM